jgi:hypothetical protein
LVVDRGGITTPMHTDRREPVCWAFKVICGGLLGTLGRLGRSSKMAEQTKQFYVTTAETLLQACREAIKYGWIPVFGDVYML